METNPAPEDARARLLLAAARLLSEGGRDALTTRAVAAAAGVQAPALYRLFGDKDGLLDAVAEHAFDAYLREKHRRAPDPDPVEDLRRGWDLHVGFGLAHPAAYALVYGDPRPGRASPAAEAGGRVLEGLVGRIARAGRLRMGEARAARLVHAAASGVVLSLLATPPEARDPGLSEAAREAVLLALTTDAPATKDVGPVAAAVLLRAALPDLAALTDAERRLLGEWLDRIADVPQAT